MRFLCPAAQGRLVFLCLAADDRCAMNNSPSDEVTAVLDVLYLALGIGGFAACLGYVYLCDRL
jgi:hypothetical protein